MYEYAKFYNLLEEVLQPREDYFDIEQIQPLLIQTIKQLIKIEDEYWNVSELSALVMAISSGHLTLTSQAERGEKGIHGTNPVHGALIKLGKAPDKTDRLDDRLTLLAHIINAAYKWRIDMQAAEEKKDFTEQIEKRLKKTTYLKNLEAACKVVRRIDADWLSFLSPLDKLTDELRRYCDESQVDEDSKQQDTYIKELGRFFAYALNKRQPRRGYQEKTERHPVKMRPVVERKRRFDDDPDDDWEETAASTLILTPDISEETEGTLRTSGLSLAEERPATELTQSDKPIKTAQGDSSLQAVFRARSQQLFQDKAAQLLPGRWEQLNAFDLHQIMQQLNQLDLTKRHRIGCVIGLLLITGRNLESVLDAQVIPGKRKIASTIDEQSIIVVHGDNPRWASGVLRPENSRQMTGEWPKHMRVTQPHIMLPIPSLSWQLIENYATRIVRRVNKRALPLFKVDNRAELASDLKKLLSETNRKTGSRLTAHRLGAHLFNTLNTGDADLTAACLITARMPSFGQQASLYYYAPSTQRLEQHYLHAMRTIERQCAITPQPEENDHTDAMANPAASDSHQYVGSKLVPKTAYVEGLVASLQQRIKAAHKSVKPLELFSMHNAYVTYTIAMLMFSTGYRSIRDPLPNWENISLTRRMIVIADKTDDEQSHARFLPLTDLMVEQLKHYQRHRKGILSRLDIYLQKGWDTPFMFLNQAGTPQEVNPTRLEVHLDWKGSPPLNINRHYLNTRLKESGLSSEVVDAFMGHWDSGQAPWESYSTFCPREYCNLIAPEIERLMHEQGWKALKGKAL